MAAQALYRRWRPQSFDDVLGQPHITQTLRNAVDGDRLAHAYLFTGPRGTGKTSVARILARAVNCTAPPGVGKPCNACALCVAMTEGSSLDLIEIDAASNTGVDDVRDLRDKIGYTPNEAKYKVYIVDEVHMLSTAAFNALLKTLEEPPNHAIFILATTEPHKIPDTIVSRCQRHDFRRASLAITVAKLERICQAEGATADRTALELIARSATGSIRDAESLLDQLIATGEAVTPGNVREVLGTPAGEVVAGLVDALVARDAAVGLALVNQALDGGADPRQLQNQTLDYLRGLLLIQTGIDLGLLNVPGEQLAHMRDQAAHLPMAALVGTIHRFNDARPAADRNLPSLPLELAVVETVLALVEPPAEPVRPTATRDPRAATPAPVASVSTGPPASRAPAPGRQVAVPVPDASPPPVASIGDGPTAVAPARAGAGPVSPPGGDDPLGRVQAQWGAFVAAVDRRDRSIGALLKDCRPVAADAASVTLGFFYDFHARRASEPERSALLSDALGAVLGSRPVVVCTVVPASHEERSARPSNKTDQARADPLVQHAINALGAHITGVAAEDED